MFWDQLLYVFDTDSGVQYTSEIGSFEWVLCVFLNTGSIRFRIDFRMERGNWMVALDEWLFSHNYW